MIAGFIPPTHAAMDLRAYEALAERWAQQQMVDPQSGISGKRIPKVVPKRIDAFARVQRAQCINPTLCDYALEG
jgi:hypothetical protein